MKERERKRKKKFCGLRKFRRSHYVTTKQVNNILALATTEEKTDIT